MSDTLKISMKFVDINSENTFNVHVDENGCVIQILAPEPTDARPAWRVVKLPIKQTKLLMRFLNQNMEL